MRRIECANKVLRAAFRRFETGARWIDGRLNGTRWFASGHIEVAEVYRAYSASTSTFQRSQGNGIELRAFESSWRQREGIGGDVKAVSIRADERLVAKTTGRTAAESRITVLADIQ